MKKKYIGDAVIIVILLLFITAVSVILYSGASASVEEISVYCDNAFFGTYSLDENRVIAISDSGVIIEIKDKVAYIKESDCINKLCMHTKLNKESNGVRSIVCLPNRVVVEKAVTGEGVDIIAG